MWTILVLAVALATINSTLAVKLPCTSSLRVVLPHLFGHCGNCYYGQWSAWKAVDVKYTGSCSSNKAYTETRTRTDYNLVCKNETEEKHTCKKRFIAHYTYVIRFEKSVTFEIHRNPHLKYIEIHTYVCTYALV